MIRIHHSSPRGSLEEREEFLLNLAPLTKVPSVVLATCDRVEVYSGTGKIPLSVARHLFAVTSGLDSPLLGENAIQGQVKRAYLEAVVRAQAQGGLGSSLHSLFQRALRVGKRIRTETSLNCGAVSHAHGAIQLMQKFLREQEVDSRETNLLVLGVNDLIEDILYSTKKWELNQVGVGNRSFQRAKLLATKYGGTAVPFDELQTQLLGATLVVCATSAPHYLIKPKHLPSDGRNRLMIDLSVPRNIDPALKDKVGVQLYNVEDLETLLQSSLKARKIHAPKAWEIVEEELEKYAYEMESGHPSQSFSPSSGQRASFLPA